MSGNKYIAHCNVGDVLQVKESDGTTTWLEVTLIIQRRNVLTGNYYNQVVWLDDHTKLERNIAGGYTRK